jgi:hypothetical protein
MSVPTIKNKGTFMPHCSSTINFFQPAMKLKLRGGGEQIVKLRGRAAEAQIVRHLCSEGDILRRLIQVLFPSGGNFVEPNRTTSIRNPSSPETGPTLFSQKPNSFGVSAADHLARSLNLDAQRRTWLSSI